MTDKELVHFGTHNFVPKAEFPDIVAYEIHKLEKEIDAMKTEKEKSARWEATINGYWLGVWISIIVGCIGIIILSA